MFSSGSRFAAWLDRLHVASMAKTAEAEERFIRATTRLNEAITEGIYTEVDKRRAIEALKNVTDFSNTTTTLIQQHS